MSKESKKLKKVATNFDFLLKDFESNPNSKAKFRKVGKDSYESLQRKVDLPSHLYLSHPYIVFIIFVYLKQFRFSGKDEKVAWEIPIKFKGVPFVLTHTKFGFGIASNESKKRQVKTIAFEAMVCIHKAIPFAEELIQPHIKELVQNGAITLHSQYDKIRKRYLFFRQKAKLEFKKAAEKAHDKTAYRYEERAAYYSTAMLDAYFSMLEHILVLLFPFARHINQSEVNIESLIGESWKPKFKMILPIAQDPEANKFLQRLDKIKEEYRNPLAHGYFLRDGHSFDLHFDNLGAIPLVLTNTRKKVNYNFQYPDPTTFGDICKCFDEFDHFLLTSDRTRYGMKYILKDLPVAFDAETVRTYKEYSTSEKEFQSFMDHVEMTMVNAWNMDW